MIVLGHIAIYISLFASLGAGLAYWRAAGNAKGLDVARRMVYAATAGVVLSSLLLVYSLVTHEFSIAYVYSYSDRSLPLHFLLSSFYAGQEGSFLFWGLCSAVIALVLMRSLKQNGDEARTMATFMLIQTGLLILVAAKSPFRPLAAAFTDVPPGFVPADGRGLNPLLQNFWMVIHPPVLFLGFAVMAAPFSYSIAGLWGRQYTQLAARGLGWVLFAVVVLGLGIMLGGYWAYGVLGWGGYWGWDPVENSSLVPWLMGIALVHTLLAQRRAEKFSRTNHLLAIATFILVLFSTFLTRSGVLGDASVHAFTDPGAMMYWLLLGFLGVVVILAVVLLLVRFREMASARTEVLWWSREMMLGVGALALVLSAVVVLAGTSTPIFSALRPEPSFYDNTNLPLAILFGLLIGVSMYMQWETSSLGDVRKGWKSLLAALLGSVALYVAGVTDGLMLALGFSALSTLSANVEIGWKIAKGNPLFLGGKIAHIGLAVFFLGVIGSGKYSVKEQAALPLHVPTNVLGYTMTYTGKTEFAPARFGFDVKVEGRGLNDVLRPVMFQAGEQGLMRNPDILSSFVRDLYLSPVSLEGESAGNTLTLEKGVAATLGEVKITLVRFDMQPHTEGGPTADGMSVGAVLEISDAGHTETIVPVLVYRRNTPQESHPVTSVVAQAALRLTTIHLGQGASTVTLSVSQIGAPALHETLMVEASVKPFMNLVWAGSLIIVAGFALAIVKRVKETN